MLAKKGANLILYDFSEDTLNKLYQELKELYPKIKIFKHIIDLTNLTELESTVQKTKEELGRDYIYCLINNAGTWNQQKLTEMSVEKFKRTFDVNVFAPMALSKLLSTDMINHKDGMIVNIASIASYFNKSEFGW